MKIPLLLSISIISTILPIMAADDWEPDEDLRVSRTNQAPAGNSHFSDEFRKAPVNFQSEAETDRPSFTLDVSRPPGRQSVYAPPLSPSITINAPTRMHAASGLRRLLGQDLQTLSSRDVILLIDKSGSMATKDCPAPAGETLFSYRSGDNDAVSRWDWCERELINLSHDAAEALPGGLKVVLFDSNPKEYSHVKPSQISYIFKQNYPEGGTDVALALSRQLENYLSARSRGERVRPLVIAIVTDGLPNNSNTLKQTLIDLSRAVHNQGEIAVTFLQIGNTQRGSRLVHELDDKLMQQGALCDLVDSKDFDELQRQGLGHALVDAINKSQTNN